MPQGFFKQSELITKAPISKLPKCGACQLLNHCKSPKMPVSGNGKRGILLVGEAPGADEDRQGRPFVGTTGQLLEKTLRVHGIEMRRDCWITNSLICHPPGNATPTPKQIEYCRPNLVNTINELKPKVIVLLGGAAVDSLLGWLWREDTKGIGRWVGMQIPHQRLNAWICPVWHPSYIARSDHKGRANPVAGVIWNRHLESIALLKGRPWKHVPDYESQIEVILNDKRAAQTIDAFIEYGGAAAFDFETNMLKPDWKDARIITASICWEGKRTIAFPWHGAVIPMFKKFLLSKLKKIASNKKFEDRWCRKVVGCRVKNWFWDTMNNAHIIDQRKDITGLKFQSFVLLGQEPYDGPIKKFLRSKGDDRINQIIKQVDLTRLLRYNGMDSLLEVLVCQIQRRRLGYE